MEFSSKHELGLFTAPVRKSHLPGFSVYNDPGHKSSFFLAGKSVGHPARFFQDHITGVSFQWGVFCISFLAQQYPGILPPPWPNTAFTPFTSPAVFLILKIKATERSQSRLTMLNRKEELMAERGEVYKCDICGNVVSVVIGGDGDLVCCGEKMRRLSQEEASKL
jgi:desulfoferrodoxin-like iron-binding protein